VGSGVFTGQKVLTRPVPALRTVMRLPPSTMA